MATKRASRSKRQRFELFKRDHFTCQYCGRTPPDVVLELDHMVALAAGGEDQPHNLITACFDCNRGKAAGSLAATPLDTSQRAEMLAERLDQSKAYDKLLRAERKARESAVAEVEAIFTARFNYGFTASSRISVATFLKKLSPVVVMEAMEKATLRINRPDPAFKYFCGVCWRIIKGGQHGTEA